MLGPRLWWQEVIVLFLVYQLFGRFRGSLPAPEVSPFDHAYQLIRVQEAMGIFVEATVQQWFLPSHLTIQFFDIYYGTVHFIVPPVVLVLLWKRDRARYTTMRNAAGFMLVLAFAGFALWPLAPPRLLPPSYEFVDTAATIGGMGALDRGNLKDDNEVAAMPSLHIGWSAWCTLAVLPVLKRRWTKVAIFAYPFVTLLAVVVTANHYLLDGVGGLVVLAGGLGLESLRVRIKQARKRRSGPSLDEPGLEAEHLWVSPVDGGLHP
ncbi:MAG: phosphatase PAP2 family protein [Acidimicrobiales bacterium]